MTRVVALAALLGVVVAAGCGSAGSDATGGDDGLLVAAASDLRPAFEELGARHREATGTTVTFAFASSGQLARQVVNGAPYDVFASADEAYVDQVVDTGHGDAGTRAVHALGRLVVWARPGASRSAVPIEDLADPVFTRIAVANPEHAPYGAAAVEALRSAGVLDDVEGRLVYGESASDTQRLVQSGNVAVGIVPVSLARAVPGGSAVAVPASHHQPIRQAVVVTASGERTAAAEAFVALLLGDEGRAVMQRHGFELPPVA